MLVADPGRRREDFLGHDRDCGAAGDGRAVGRRTGFKVAKTRASNCTKRSQGKKLVGSKQSYNGKRWLTVNVVWLKRLRYYSSSLGVDHENNGCCLCLLCKPFR